MQVSSRLEALWFHAGVSGGSVRGWWFRPCFPVHRPPCLLLSVRGKEETRACLSCDPTRSLSPFALLRMVWYGMVPLLCSFLCLPVCLTDRLCIDAYRKPCSFGIRCFVWCLCCPVLCSLAVCVCTLRLTFSLETLDVWCVQMPRSSCWAGRSLPPLLSLFRACVFL